MKAMSHDLRERITLAIKNGSDISELIKGVSIKGENLSGALITEFDVTGQDISRCDFSRATIGTKDNVVYMNNTRARECSFVRATFPGKVMARRADFTGSSFKGAFIPYADYKFADLRGCTFCDTVFSIGTPRAAGAMFSEDFFKDLAKYWGIEITIRKGVDYGQTDVD
jgi:uncharacterized protein YjbI with pentapeptide repeats